MRYRGCQILPSEEFNFVEFKKCHKYSQIMLQQFKFTLIVFWGRWELGERSFHAFVGPALRQFCRFLDDLGIENVTFSTLTISLRVFGYLLNFC